MQVGRGARDSDNGDTALALKCRDDGGSKHGPSERAQTKSVDAAIRMASTGSSSGGGSETSTGVAAAVEVVPRWIDQAEKLHRDPRVIFQLKNVVGNWENDLLQRARVAVLR